MGASEFSKRLVDVLLELINSKSRRIGVLGAGYLADKLINSIEISGNEKLNIEWVLQRKYENQITGNVRIIREISDITEVDMIINAEMVHPVWAKEVKQTFQNIEMCDLEEIIRCAENCR